MQQEPLGRDRAGLDELLHGVHGRAACTRQWPDTAHAILPRRMDAPFSIHRQARRSRLPTTRRNITRPFTVFGLATTLDDLITMRTAPCVHCKRLVVERAVCTVTKAMLCGRIQSVPAHREKGSLIRLFIVDIFRLKFQPQAVRTYNRSERCTMLPLPRKVMIP